MARLFANRAEAEHAQLAASDNTLPSDGVDLRQVRLTIEARRRYRERLHGPLPETQEGRPYDRDEVQGASEELRLRMVTTGRFQTAAPPWVGMKQEAGRRTQSCVGYVVIDDEAALPLVRDRHDPDRLVAVTTLWVPSTGELTDHREPGDESPGRSS
jgi:hypothetical protein